MIRIIFSPIYLKQNSLYNIYLLKQQSKNKQPRMYQHYNNYYYVQHNLPPFTQFYDFCQHYYIQEQMWNTHTFSSITYEMPKEQAHQIIPWKTEQVKRQQIDENFLFQIKKQKLATDCMLAKQAQISKTAAQISLKQSSQQKQNRNVYSNILRSFFRKLHDTSKIKELLRVIIKKRNLCTTAENFIKYLRKLKIDHGKYLRVKRLKNHFKNQRLKQHAMVLRILFQHYRKDQLLIQTLTSKKISKWIVKLHLKGARDLKNKIFC